MDSGTDGVCLFRAFLSISIGHGALLDYGECSALDSALVRGIYVKGRSIEGLSLATPGEIGRI